MEHGGGSRWQDARYAQADERPIEADNKAVVVLDAAHQGHGQLPQAHQLPQAVGGDGDVGDLPGDGRPVADGDARVRLGEGWGVVDAVPYHENGVPFPPQSSNILRLVRWEHAGPEIVHSQLLRNGSSCAGAVPGEHDGVFHAQIPQGRARPSPPPAGDRRCRARRRALHRWPDTAGNTPGTGRRT